MTCLRKRKHWGSRRAAADLEPRLQTALTISNVKFMFVVHVCSRHVFSPGPSFRTLLYPVSRCISCPMYIPLPSFSSSSPCCLPSAFFLHWHPSLSCLRALSSSPPPPHRSSQGSVPSWFIFSSPAILRM